MRICPARLGYTITALTFALDQASKLWLLFGMDLPARDPIVVAPFMSFITVWNRGISYGLFQQGTDIGRWMLVVLSCIATAALVAWIRKAESPFLTASLGLIAGGAAGNAVDRACYGAVFDFVYLHAGGYSWYVFNIADAAIVAGVAGLIYHSAFHDRATASPSKDGIARP